MKNKQGFWCFFRSIKHLSRLYLFIGMLISVSLYASENNIGTGRMDHAMTIGTPTQFLAQIGFDSATSEQLQQQTLMSSEQRTHLPVFLQLPDNFANEINVTSHSATIEADGAFSMSGQVVDRPNSKFILQGNANGLYGWVILEEFDQAYEYTTQAGQVLVNEIPITAIRPICNLEYHQHAYTTATSQLPLITAASVAPHIGSYTGEHVGKLQSRPGSSYVIFLDTTKVMDDGVPYDVSKEFIWTTWQIVAASFSMFDVNVTTDLNVYNQALPSRRGGGTMYRQDGRSSCHFAFGTSTFCTLYKEVDASGQGRTAAHEFGHLLHLAHDGGAPGGEYHQGLADFQWVPIMGNYWFGNRWPHALYQWSKGEYAGASNREDDFAQIQRFIPFKQDDNTSSKALIVSTNGSVNAQQNTGQIERNTDTDEFTFKISGSSGKVNLTIDRIEHIGGAMLDVQAYIKNNSGSVVAQSNKNVNRSASFNQSLPAGNYTLAIEGGAEGSPSNGFSNYSSMGYFAISGSITGSGGGDNTAPVANFTMQKNNLLVSFINRSTDDKGVTDYAWNFGDTHSSDVPNPNHTFANEGSYSVSLTVTDAEGETDTVAKTLVVSRGTTNEAPKADFSLSKENLNVSFTDNSSDDKAVIRYEWQFGDGHSSATKNPTHNYSTAGNYTVMLTVFDEEGLHATQSKSVSVSSGSDCSIAVWDSAKTYTNRDQASQAGNIYQAKWWTRNQSPADFSGRWQVWELISDCD